jgi:hypothetical protein
MGLSFKLSRENLSSVLLLFFKNPSIQNNGLCLFFFNTLTKQYNPLKNMYCNYFPFTRSPFVATTLHKANPKLSKKWVFSLNHVNGKPMSYMFTCLVLVIQVFRRMEQPIFS